MKILDKLPAACACGHPFDWAVPRAAGKDRFIYICPICRKEYLLTERP